MDFACAFIKFISQDVVACCCETSRGGTEHTVIAVPSQSRVVVLSENQVAALLSPIQVRYHVT